MSWTAIVPLKQGAARKSRLAARLSQDQRHGLVDRMTTHVLEQLRNAPSITRIVIISTEPGHHAGIGWECDRGLGLNAELERTRACLPDAPVVFIHADLPLLTICDIEELLRAAAAGCAIAPDRHGSGTNAIALQPGMAFNLSFGTGSFLRHIDAACGKARVVEKQGLALDIDTPDDIDAAIALGWQVDSASEPSKR